MLVPPSPILLSPQHKQDAHSTNENSHSTNENSHSTTKSRRFIVPLSRLEEKGNHLPVVGEALCRSSCFLTRVYSIFFWMHSIKYLSGILILYCIYITIIKHRSHAGKYKAIQHTLVTFCNSTNHQGAGELKIIYLRLKRKNSHKDNNKS